MRDLIDFFPVVLDVKALNDTFRSALTATGWFLSGKT